MQPEKKKKDPAAIHGGLPLQSKRVGIVISGGNVDLARFASLLSE